MAFVMLTPGHCDTGAHSRLRKHRMSRFYYLVGFLRSRSCKRLQEVVVGGTIIRWDTTGLHSLVPDVSGSFYYFDERQFVQSVLGLMSYLKVP